MQSCALLGGIVIAQMRYPLVVCGEVKRRWATLQWVQYQTKQAFGGNCSLYWELLSSSLEMLTRLLRVCSLLFTRVEGYASASPK